MVTIGSDSHKRTRALRRIGTENRSKERRGCELGHIAWGRSLLSVRRTLESWMRWEVFCSVATQGPIRGPVSRAWVRSQRDPVERTRTVV